jgi:hypothetical protein
MPVDEGRRSASRQIITAGVEARRVGLPPYYHQASAGATKPEQLAASFRAADWHLTQAEMQEIDRLIAPPNHRAPQIIAPP